MCDLLWSDPEEQTGWAINPRGAGYVFGQEQTCEFNHTNNLKMIVRAHQMMMEGHASMHDKGVTTIFSAPNYCYRCANMGAIVEVDENLGQNYIKYDPAPRNGKEVDRKRVPDYFL